MHHALRPDEPVSHLPDLAALPLHQDHLHAHMVIQVHVEGRDDGGAHLVLDGVQFVGKLSNVMVVDQGDGADGLLVRLPLSLHQKIPDEVAKGFGAVTVPLLFDEAVETLQEPVRDGDPEPGSFFAHV